MDIRLTEAEQDLERIKTFLNQISIFISEQELSDNITTAEKAAQEAAILGARSSIDAARGAVSGARQSLAGAIGAQTIASLTESKLVIGTRNEDLLAAQAAVTQAQGLYAGALATLEHTLIRTPIAGTVTTFNVARGEFIPSQNVIAVVANAAALEVEAFVSNLSLDRIVVGQQVLVDGQYKASITSAAPGLDPVTKKARITIGLNEEADLANGSFVEVAIQSNDSEKTQATDKLITEFRIPVTAIKVLPRGLAVFVVTEEETLAAITITEGPIVGAHMLVKEGLTAETRIVVDVRGHAEGDNVSIAAEN